MGLSKRWFVVVMGAAFIWGIWAEWRIRELQEDLGEAVEQAGASRVEADELKEELEQLQAKLGDLEDSSEEHGTDIDGLKSDVEELQAR